MGQMWVVVVVVVGQPLPEFLFFARLFTPSFSFLLLFLPNAGKWSECGGVRNGFASSCTVVVQ